MPKRINKVLDTRILTDLASGCTQSELAKKYGVSRSYISKIKCGKKKSFVYSPTTYNDSIFNYKGDDLKEISDFLDTVPLVTDKSSIAEYAEHKYKEHILLAKMYKNIADTYIKKGE